MDFKGVDFRIATVKNNDGTTEIYFEHIGSWDDCGLIQRILVKENECSVIEEKDMVTDKDVLMQFKNIKFKLTHHYMLGNYLFTRDDSAVPILKQLAQNVIDSITQKLKAKGLL